MSSELIAGIIGAIAGMTSSIPIGLLTYRLALRRFKTEHATQLAAGKVLREMLSSDKYSYRSLEQMCRVLGGMAPERVREQLLAVGAIRVADIDGKEVWAIADSPLALDFRETICG